MAESQLKVSEEKANGMKKSAVQDKVSQPMLFLTLTPRLFHFLFGASWFDQV